jgi:hypothetical protein
LAAASRVRVQWLGRRARDSSARVPRAPPTRPVRRERRTPRPVGPSGGRARPPRGSSLAPRASDRSLPRRVREVEQRRERARDSVVSRRREPPRERLARGARLAQEERRLDGPAPQERRAVQQLCERGHRGGRAQRAGALVPRPAEDERHAQDDPGGASLHALVAGGQRAAGCPGVREHRLRLSRADRRVRRLRPQESGPGPPCAASRAGRADDDDGARGSPAAVPLLPARAPFRAARARPRTGSRATAQAGAWSTRRQVPPRSPRGSRRSSRAPSHQQR